jgi:hypothetical protein
MPRYAAFLRGVGDPGASGKRVSHVRASGRVQTTRTWQTLEKVVAKG